MDQQVIVLFLTAVTAIASLGAAWGAWRSSWATRLTAEAALCTGFLEKYVSKEMLDALWLLSNLKRERGERFADQWIRARSNKEQWALDIDEARRHVSGYFINLAQLYEGGLITEKLLRTAGCLQSGIAIVFEVCEPLEQALNPEGYGKQYFEILKRMCGSPAVWDDRSTIAANP